MIGSEPISERSMARFTEAFAPCGFRAEAFYPCYGLAEATLLVAGGSKADRPVVRTLSGEELTLGNVVDAGTNAPDARRLVGCGRPWLDQRGVIVNPETRLRLPPGKVGEIWVAGPSVGQGYWNRPEMSEQTFQARLEDDPPDTFLRTGDLGRLDDDGPPAPDEDDGQDGGGPAKGGHNDQVVILVRFAPARVARSRLYGESNDFAYATCGPEGGDQAGGGRSVCQMASTLLPSGSITKAE